jgi:hypothetical protein
MRIFSDFSEIKAAVGTEIGASEWVEITQDRINRFAEATCDEQWIARQLSHGSKIESGQRPACVAELVALHYG